MSPAHYLRRLFLELSDSTHRIHAHKRCSQVDTLRVQSQEATMRDRPQSGSRRASQAASHDKYRGEFRYPGLTVVQAIVVALMLVQLGLSQTLFDVRNPKPQKWPEADANRVYMSTARVIAAEFKLPQPIYAHFTLILGADENSVDIDARELRLK